MSEKKCKDCKFSSPHTHSLSVQCRRFPPVLIRIRKNAGAVFNWPWVFEDEWCGEFKRKGGFL